MNIISKILKNRDLIVEELNWWAITFMDELDDENMPSLEAYQSICDLADRLENNNYTNNDIQEIIFHIEQINYLEEKVIL